LTRGNRREFHQRATLQRSGLPPSRQNLIFRRQGRSRRTMAEGCNTLRFKIS